MVILLARFEMDPMVLMALRRLTAVRGRSDA
jgi:hypothetical protein